ncbi:hypothetical protein [Microbulbifer sp. JMSA003]|uniref:hypothetical protein n=1 Tax=Microbulbifer sp. JMSA003 TaxID=3243369 RepID=UPI002B30A56E|nr:hypothetical protein QT397_26075 [Microbulbifer sp. MKSA007]
MSPVAAVLTVFALVLGAVAWLRLLFIGFSRDPLSGLIALFMPPLALLLLLPDRRENSDLYSLCGTSLLCLLAALTLR